MRQKSNRPAEETLRKKRLDFSYNVKYKAEASKSEDWENKYLRPINAILDILNHSWIFLVAPSIDPRKHSPIYAEKAWIRLSKQ